MQLEFDKLYYNLKSEISFSHDNYINKHKPLITKYIKKPIIPYIEKELSIFIEILIKMDKILTSYMISSPNFHPTQIKVDGWLEMENILLFISKQFNTYYYSLDMNYEIEKEYINIITNKKTYLIKTKQGSIIYDENKQDEIIHKKLNKILNFCIEYTIYPKKREHLIRKMKIDNILV